MDGAVVIILIFSVFIVFSCIIYCIYACTNEDDQTIHHGARIDRSDSVSLDEQNISLQPLVNAEETGRARGKKKDKSRRLLVECDEICRHCSGNGYKLCRECKGDRTITKLIDDEKGREIYEKEICDSCDGNGQHICEYCHGIPRKKFKSYGTSNTKSKESNKGKSGFEKTMAGVKHANTAYTAVSNISKIVKALS